MYLKTFVIFMIVNITIAYQPVIFHKDNAVIASEPMKLSLPQHHNIIPGIYPQYEVVNNPQSIIHTRGAAPLKADNLPADLIEIAKTKLGIKNLNEIPSLSEIGSILGTTSREETIETIRELTETKSGIDLIKAFIESADYTDSTAIKEDHIQIEADTSKPPLPTVFLSETTQKDLEIIKKVLSTTQQDLGFFQRIGSYLNIFDLFPENKEIVVSESENEVNQIKPKPENKNHESLHQRHINLQPISITNRFPNSFPVPYRPGAVSPIMAPSTHRAMKEDRHFSKLKTLNYTFGGRFLN